MARAPVAVRMFAGHPEAADAATRAHGSAIATLGVVVHGARGFGATTGTFGFVARSSVLRPCTATSDFTATAPGDHAGDRTRDLSDSN